MLWHLKPVSGRQRRKEARLTTMESRTFVPCFHDNPMFFHLLSPHVSSLIHAVATARLQRSRKPARDNPISLFQSTHNNIPVKTRRDDDRALIIFSEIRKENQLSSLSLTMCTDCAQSRWKRFVALGAAIVHFQPRWVCHVPFRKWSKMRGRGKDSGVSRG
jgi:hypothetical protein